MPISSLRSRKGSGSRRSTATKSLSSRRGPTAVPACYSLVAMREACACGHSDNSHVYPGSTLFGDCHECRCELYNPPGGLKGVPLHPLFAFTENEFRFVSCAQCSRFRVLPGGVCEGCGWDNDNHGIVEDTRPNYCRDSPTKQHHVPSIAPGLPANYCTCCLRTIQNGKAKKGEHVMRFWKTREKS